MPGSPLESNSTSVPLLAGAAWTGSSYDVSAFPSVMFAVLTDKSGMAQMQFSPDGTNWDSRISFGIESGVNDVHRLTVTRRYYRATFTNTSLDTQGFFRLQSMLGSQQTLTSALNSTIQNDADAVITRSIGEETMIAQGKVNGYALVNKVGRNPDVDTATTPEDIWNGGGTYLGFPTTGTAERVVVASSSNADSVFGTGARQLNIIGLDGNYNQISESVFLSGTTGVLTNQSFWRIHTSSVLSGANSAAFNVGVISGRHQNTPGNVFFAMPQSRNQTNVAGYTVPAKKTAYLTRIHGVLRGSTTTTVYADCDLWVREFGQAPRLRRPFSLNNSSHFSQEIYGGVALPEKTDVNIRVSYVSANNLDIVAGYDLKVVNN